jgi:hypothetical protein
LIKPGWHAPQGTWPPNTTKEQQLGRKLVLWVLGYAWLALVIGVGGLGMAIYSSYSAGHGGGSPAEADLTSVSGTVIEGREVTVERKRRRGGKTTSQFYELDLKPDTGGELLKLRVAHEIPMAQLSQAIGEKVTARYNAIDENMVFGLKFGQAELVSYADMGRILTAKAEADRDFFASASALGFFVLMALLGGGGVYLRRKMVAAAA